MGNRESSWFCDVSQDISLEGFWSASLWSKFIELIHGLNCSTECFLNEDEPQQYFVFNFIFEALFNCSFLQQITLTACECFKG